MAARQIGTSAGGTFRRSARASFATASGTRSPRSSARTWLTTWRIRPRRAEGHVVQALDQLRRAGAQPEDESPGGERGERGRAHGEGGRAAIPHAEDGRADPDAL